MPKEFYRKYPFTSSAFGVVTLLLFASLVAGRDSVITNTIFQLEWCGVGNYACVLLNHFIFASVIIGVGFLIDFVFFRKRKYVENPQGSFPKLQASNNSVGMQNVNNSPVVKAEHGIASGRDTYLTQNFFPPNNPQKVSFPTISGNIEFRHIQPRLDPQGNETECKIVIINNSGQNFSKCVAYIAKVAHKSKKDKQWLPLPVVPSGQPLKWDSLFSSFDGFIGIDDGHQNTLSLFEVQTKRYSRDGSTYNYFLTFYRSTIPLLQETATSHRILIRFHGGQHFGGGGVDKKVYIYLNENKTGYKTYVGMEEFKGDG